MRQRDPTHEHRLRQLLGLEPEECKRQIAITDYRQPDYVASEVLASLIRARFGQETGALDAAAATLHQRVVRGAETRIHRKEAWRELRSNNSEAAAEAIAYFWDMFLHDRQDVCNAEVRFAVYLQNKVDDYMIHLLANKNTMESTDDMGATDEDGNEANFVDVVEDPNGESPEEAVLREQSFESVNKALMDLSREERNAFYFRVECGYDWTKVAKFLKCSTPTARKLVKSAMQTLEGAL